jgi:hypothetical protein
MVVRARRALPSERGVEGMKMGMSCGGGGRGVAPFYRVGEVAGRVVMAAVVRFQGGGRLRRGGEEEVAPIEGGERRRRLGDIRSRAEEVVRGARCGRPSGGVRVSEAGGRRRLGSLIGWAHLSVRGSAMGRLGWKGMEEAGPGLGWKRREEAGPNPLLGLKSKRVMENQF